MKFLLFALFFTVTSFAIDREVPPSIAIKMKNFDQAMEKLLPIAFSNKEISEKEAITIKKNIMSMISNLKGLEGHFSSKDSRTPFITDLLRTQLVELEESINDRSFEYAKSVTKSIPKICISCHLQDRIEVLQISKLPVDKFDGPLHYAEYLEMIRNFEAAEKVYTSILTNSKSSEESKNQALTKIITLEIRVFNQPAKSIEKLIKLESMLKDIKIKTRLAVINAELLKYNKKTEFNYLKLKDENIELESSQFEQKISNLDSYLLSDEELVNIQIFLANLYDYTNNSDQQKNLPVALYYISLLEKKSQRGIFYSLSDLYLKKCIKDFSKHPYARRCFNKYKQNIKDSFTGSRGTHIPLKVKKELDQFQSLFPELKP